MLIVCPDCQKQFSDRAPTCPNCGRPGSFTPAASAQTSLQGPVGLGGWLILVQILLFLHILIGLSYFIFFPGANNVILGILTTALTGHMIYLLYKKSHSFPRVSIGYVVVGLLAEFFLGSGDIGDGAVFLIMNAISVFFVLLWILYMLNAKRVKNTFVN